jgi:hypothetical protein
MQPAKNVGLLPPENKYEAIRPRNQEIFGNQSAESLAGRWVSPVTLGYVRAIFFRGERTDDVW